MTLLQPTARVDALTGDEVVAEAVRQSNVDVVAAYPITPQTIMVEKLDEYYADGRFRGEFVPAESEHSAISVCVGAAATGARVFTATSSQGLAYMHEMLYDVSGMRLPIVMAVANRALSAPLVLNADHGDMMGSRDSGWIQVYAEDVQEVYDRTIQLFRISEHAQVRLPSTLNFEGFTLSHDKERVTILDDDTVARFVGRPSPPFRLDPASPTTFGAMTSPDSYFEFKMQQAEAMKAAAQVFAHVEDEFASVSGRRYGAVGAYGVEEADTIVIVNGASSGTVRHAAREFNKSSGRGEIGVLAIKLYRPFPETEVLRSVKGAKSVVVLDRSLSLGAPAGPLTEDVATVISRAGLRLPLMSVAYGIGGRDFAAEDATRIFALARDRSSYSNEPRMWGAEG